MNWLAISIATAIITIITIITIISIIYIIYSIWCIQKDNITHGNICEHSNGVWFNPEGAPGICINKNAIINVQELK